MKILSMFCLIISSGLFTYAGTYSYLHPVYSLAEDPTECLSGENSEFSEDYACLKKDSVIFEEVNGKYNVKIETISTIGHTCYYEANNGKFITPSVLVSSTPTFTDINDKNNNRSVATTCIVTIRIKEDHSIEVKTNNEHTCQDLCGYNASLRINKAVTP